MGREVRKVPGDWEHPRDRNTGHYRPMLDEPYLCALASWREELPEWYVGRDLWATGFVKTYDGSVRAISDVVCESRAHGRFVPDNPPYEWWAGERPPCPDPGDHMPDWPESERTHFMMYEDVSEGTPISPAFATPEELARWLADTGASAMGSETASYEGWLRIAKGGSAPSLIMRGGQMMSGVEALKDYD